MKKFKWVLTISILSLIFYVVSTNNVSAAWTGQSDNITWHFEQVTVIVSEPTTATGTVKVYYVTQNADGTLTQVKEPVEIVVPLGTTITSDGINIVTLHFPDGTSKTLEVPQVDGYGYPVTKVEISDYEKYTVK